MAPGKNYYNFQYGITTGFMEFDYRTHAGLFKNYVTSFSSELKK